MPAQGDDVNPEEYSAEAFNDLVTNGMLLPEIMPLIRKIVFPFTDLPESMRLQAYDVFKSTRFHYPCAIPCRRPSLSVRLALVQASSPYVSLLCHLNSSSPAACGFS